MFVLDNLQMHMCLCAQPKLAPGEERLVDQPMATLQWLCDAPPWHDADGTTPEAYLGRVGVYIPHQEEVRYVHSTLFGLASFRFVSVYSAQQG